MKKSVIALFLAILVAPLSAQLPKWTTLKSSSPSMFFCEASLVVVQDSAGYHLWSSYTRAWSDIAASANATFYGYDDHCVIVDGKTAYGYATRHGVVSKIYLNNTPTVPPPSKGAQWVVVLIDGNDAHVFSGLLGTWTTVKFSSVPLASLGRMVAILSDGTRTVGVSAHFGTPVDLGIPGIISTDAVGYCGVARDPGNFHMFSAHRNKWRTIAASAQANLIKPPSRAGYVIVQESYSLNFYSALTDNQVVIFTGGQIGSLKTDADVAVIQIGNNAFAYSCATGTMDMVTTTSTSGLTLDVQREIVIASDDKNVWAFGLLVGKFTLPRPGTIVAANTGTALISNSSTTRYEAFSCMTNKWVEAPAGTYTANYVTYNGIVLVDTTGKMQGFSANRGTWTSQAAPKADSYYSHKASFCARAGNRLDAFNGRTGEWATVTTSAQATVTCFDMAVVADDGKNVYCYGCYQDKWASTACVTTKSEPRDECAYFYDNTTVHCWSGSSQVSEWANIPEYWRILARGGRLNYNIAGEPGASGTVAIGIAPANLPTVFGTLRVNLSAAVLLPVSIPKQGTASISFNVPDLPSLRGVTLFSQGLIAPTSGAYLTEYFESTIM